MIRYVVSGRWIWDRDASQYYAITISRPIRIDGHAVKLSRSTRGACLNKANRIARMATISAVADIVNLDSSKIDRLSVGTGNTVAVSPSVCVWRNRGAPYTKVCVSRSLKTVC